MTLQNLDLDSLTHYLDYVNFELDLEVYGEVTLTYHVILFICRYNITTQFAIQAICCDSVTVVVSNYQIWLLSKSQVFIDLQNYFTDSRAHHICQMLLVAFRELFFSRLKNRWGRSETPSLPLQSGR